MPTTALTLALIILPTLTLTAGGLATYAHPATLERAATLRQLPPCDDCIGMVALLEAEHIGKKIYLQRVGGKIEGPFLVVDCAGHGRPFPRWLVEVDYQTARRWGMRAPIFVSLWMPVESAGRRVATQ